MRCVPLRCYGWPSWPAKGNWILGTWILGGALNFALQPAIAADPSPELVQPPIYSATTAGQLGGICAVTPIGSQNNVKVNLTAASAAITIGGYKVVTENYNGNYLTPVIEAMPGDTVSAHLVNALTPRPHAGMAHGDPNDNPTNLHYFHGGIVSPNNARPKPAELGTGDNIYVHLKSGVDAKGQPNSFDFEVPIPGENMLDARVLETEGQISHPVGLNWYHSHMHGISANQVMGGMSGLLSVGAATANVKAACIKDPNDEFKCLNDVEKDTRDLKDRTRARYALLRDIPLKMITKLPGEANGDAAEWDQDPASRGFPPGTPCGVWKPDTSTLDLKESLRTGFCQRSKDTALLFTLNGQRFPTITVEGGQNLLLRFGNLSSNVPYWLELVGEADNKVLPLTILSIDGVVPANPALPGQAQKPILALNDDNALLMPAARAEVYVRNDENPHAVAQVYILRTKRHLVKPFDEWPEIQLARIVLQPNAVASKTLVALNAPVAKVTAALAIEPRAEKVELPDGCVRDLDPAFHEYRRVSFFGRPNPVSFNILTEIVRPTAGPPQDEANYAPDKPSETSVALGANFDQGVPFENYVGSDGLVDWTKRHVCIQIDHRGSHKQLWVLSNGTAGLHNFHIHQMKFRLATVKELRETYFIEPPPVAKDCPRDNQGVCIQPKYELYDDQTSDNLDPGATRRWHDTIPLPPFQTVFLVMSFDAKQQIGRFVFHCHILKHEDVGLMAPIEVWEPQVVSQLK
jgi:FtsP/CotA-like multicopper oxidase with cupredoxin domain